MLPAFVFGASSGAHFNPAPTLALAAGVLLHGAVHPECAAELPF